MKKVNATMPTYQEILGKMTYNFPDDFTWPVSCVIREAAMIANGAAAEVRLAGFGKVTLKPQPGKGRYGYVFEPDAAYAAKRGLADKIEGDWG